MEHKIERIAQEFGHRLGLSPQFIISIAKDNPRLAAAQCETNAKKAFRISFDFEFLLTLDDRELDAAVAHELGHIWIFTHFPFLQTEVLANHQALRLVPRRDLARIYEKMWKWNGRQGNLEQVLGPAD
jgi:hypothetical protein